MQELTPNKPSKLTAKKEPKNFVPMGEWIPILPINGYLKKHLTEHPEKCRFGIDDNNILCFIVDK